jgi:hypothetical protein
MFNAMEPWMPKSAKPMPDSFVQRHSLQLIGFLHVLQGDQTVSGNVNRLDRAQRRTYQLLATKRIVVNVIGEILPESFYEGLVVLRRVKLLRTEKPSFPVLPRSREHVNVEERFEVGWNVLEESENPPFWMLVPEGVEDEALLSDESVAVSGKPIFG